MRLSAVRSLQVFFIGLLNVRILGKSIGAASETTELLVDPVAYLRKGGYIQGDQLGRSELTPEEFSLSLRRLQNFFRIPQTGIMDEETIKIMNQPRCSVPDIIDRSNTTRERYAHSGRKWLTYDISWRVGTVEGSSFSRSQLEGLMRRAANEWAYPTLLNFQQSSSSLAQVLVGFYQRADGDHGDGAPFSQTDLGHAYYPGVQPIDGDMHMNMNQRFYISYQSYDFYGSDLFFTTVHEIGHSLGLDHSGNSGAVMYPTLRRGRNYAGLSYDDVAGIQSAYGRNPYYTGSAPAPVVPSLFLLLIGSLLLSLIIIN